MRRFVLLAIIVSCCWPAAAAEQVGRYEWTGVERVVAVGDVHASHDKLTQLLTAVHLIDASGNWIGEAAHLVLVGDLIDRGARDRAVLDLLRTLQEQAPRSGGRVHVLNGNHEVMNLVRDLRYVNPQGYADFAEEEDPKQRKAWFKRFRRSYDGPDADAEVVFEKRYPPGYFGRIAAFNPDGEYGAWLLDQPILVKINDVIFVHGGLTERVASLGLDEINRQVMDELKAHLKVRRRLESRSIVDQLMTFGDAQSAAQRFYDRNHTSLAARTWVESVIEFGDLPESELFGTDGPMWYRGNSLENERIERARLERTLEALSARALVVAHSPTGEKTITSRFGGRLYRIDHGMAYGARPLALILEDRMAFVFDPGSSEEPAPPVPELPQGESVWAHVGEMTDEELTELLTSGEVVAMRDLGRGSTRPKLVELESGERRMRAIFKTVDERPGKGYSGQVLDSYRQEVAAYRLDRLLDLGFVPVTVLRKVDGIEGSMQQWVEDAIDGETLRDYGLLPADPAMMERQSALGLAFEYLIGNASRSENDLLYLLAESRVMCVDHSKSFPVVGIDATLPETLEPDFIVALAGIDEKSVEGALGDLLSESQIQALLSRRNDILEYYSGEREHSRNARGGPGVVLNTIRARELERRGSLAWVRAQVAAHAPTDPQSWTNKEKEHYLQNAKIVATKYIGEGITRPKKVTLELDGVTLKAAFKYHEEFRPGVTQFDDGPREVNFRDSYLFDRAAYLLDLELGMGMVPATVLREVEDQTGALVWWVPDSISEVDRIQSRVEPGDPTILRRQQDVARLFYALVENTDENLHNQLVTVHDWRLHLIDLTRAFRFSKNLPDEFEKTPISLPRETYRRLQDLTKDRLISVMAGVLSKAQVKVLLTRRDAIVAKIERDIEANGENVVFQD